MADKWEMANLEQAVESLEYEKEEYRLLLIQARWLLENIGLAESSNTYIRRLKEFLKDLPR